MTDRQPKSNAAVIGAVIVLGAIVVGAVVVFALRPGTDPSRLLSFLGGVIVPTIPALLAYGRADKAVKQTAAVVETVANVAADVGDVKEQTNGALHALVEQVQAANGNPLPSPDGTVHQQGQADSGTGRHSSEGGS